MSPKPKVKDSYNNNNEESYNGNTFATLGNVGKLDKKLLKEIIQDKGSPKVLEKKIFKSRNINKNSEIERSPKLINHSFDAPLTYKKKIIKRYSNIPKKKKNQYKMQRTKTEDKLKPLMREDLNSSCVRIRPGRVLGRPRTRPRTLLETTF